MEQNLYCSYLCFYFIKGFPTERTMYCNVFIIILILRFKQYPYRINHKCKFISSFFIPFCKFVTMWLAENTLTKLLVCKTKGWEQIFWCRVKYNKYYPGKKRQLWCPIPYVINPVRVFFFLLEIIFFPKLKAKSKYCKCLKYFQLTFIKRLNVMVRFCLLMFVWMFVR